VSRSLLHRIHNPKNYECGCDPDCWCNRTRIGRVVKWWFPARYFGLRHKNSFFDGRSMDEIRAWKEEQAEKGLYPMWSTQPRYESIVRLGYMRYGLGVRRADGTRAVHEIGGRGVDPGT
jgi:hypothetical protein